jgi:hypothetical protein
MRERYSTELAIVSGIIIAVVAVAFALVQSPEIYQPEKTIVSNAQGIPHPVKGIEECNSCHGIKGMFPYPQGHLGWSNQSCVKCHAQSGR